MIANAENCDWTYDLTCYNLNKEDLYYWYAELECIEQNSKLLDFDDLEEFEFVRKYVNKSELCV